jgi:hypothetical protein
MKELKPSRRSKKLLDDFFLFDTETGDTLKNGDVKWKLDARPESFIFGCVYGKNYKRTITSVREFQQEFQHPRYKNKRVYAHNAEYDLNAIFGNIYQFDNNAIFNGRFISATNGNCTFADSLNIYRASVADIGEKMGYPKLQLGDDKGKLISKGGYTQKDVEYCFRDCEIMWFALLKIFEDAGGQKITQASLSLVLFRTRFLRKGIKHNEQSQTFWDSYYGGRCEAFYIGEVNAKLIDVNSTYPAIMRNSSFPDPNKICFEEPKTHSRIMSIMNNFDGCIYATVLHHESWIGYLPVKRDNKLIFPIGTFSGCWNFNEFKFAVDSGMVSILKVDKIVYAPRIESPFINYVDTLYKQRFETDDKLEIERIKIFMNSLYGKFGARLKEQNIYLPDWRASAKLIKDHLKNGTFIDLMLFNGERQDAFLIVKSTMDLGENGMSYSIPSFASYITSGARVKLLRKGIELYNKGMNPVYCDTDSWAYNSKDELPNETHLGGWKLESKVLTHVHGLKNYEFIDSKGEKQRKLKGVPKSAIKLEGKNRYQFIAMIRTKESLRRNIDSGIFEIKTKDLSLKYDKRLVLKDGKTKPFQL